MKTRDLNCAECIKDEDQIVLVKEEIKERWKDYYEKLYNWRDTWDWSNLSKPIEDRNLRSTWVKNENEKSWV